MRRTVLDLGISLQAPEGWVRVETRGNRIVIRDSSCTTPIFIEPLLEIRRVDEWIAELATGGRRVTNFQQTPDFRARRFVLTAAAGRAAVQRAYQVHRTGSGHSSGWVAASIDLDGDVTRTRMLDAVFPSVAGDASLRGPRRLVQHLEDDQHPAAGQPGPGFTVSLPRLHAVRELDGDRYLIQREDTPIGWMKIESLPLDRVESVLNRLKQNHEASIEDLSERVRLVVFATAPDGGSRAQLLIAGPDDVQLVIDVASEAEPDHAPEFLRAMYRDVRIWDAEFRGYWRPPVGVDWKDAKLALPRPAPPAPVPPPPPASAPTSRRSWLPPAPPVPPGQQLQAEWNTRLSGAYLTYQSTGSAGYDPRFSFGSYRKDLIVLHTDHGVTWEETVHTSASYAGIYVGGPSETRRTGVWRVELENGTPHLMLYCGSDGGVHRFDLSGGSTPSVSYKGRSYKVIK